jgi:hypothetical protein
MSVKFTSSSERPGYASVDVSVGDAFHSALLMRPGGTFTLHIPTGEGAGTILVLQLRGTVPAAGGTPPPE